MSSKTEKNIKRAIVVLSALLLLSVCLLIGAIYCYKRVAPTVVPDNTISVGEKEVKITPRNTEVLMISRMPEHADDEGTLWKSTDASILKLYKGQNFDETSFAVSNMFPGDALYKEYLVQVRHRGIVTVHFTANVHPSADPVNERLEEVLMCKVEANGELLYEGLMRDIPDSLTYETPYSKRAATTEIPYRITAYLDGPSVGNAHMNKSLTADFKWWVLVDKEEDNTDRENTGGDYSEPTGGVSETEPIQPSLEVKGEVESDAEPEEDFHGELAVLPMTGDNTIWFFAAILLAGGLLILLLRGRRKEESNEQ